MTVPPPASPAGPTSSSSASSSFSSTAIASTSSPVLAIQGLRVILRASRRQPATMLLRDVDLVIDPGCIHGLVGESGAGKSMITRTVLGITPPGASVTAGTIRFDDMDWLALSAAERRRHLGRDIALIPQDPLSALNPAYPIARQIGDVLRLHRGLDHPGARREAGRLLDSVRIGAPERVLDQYPHQLSGGMRQRVLIAMAFACRPKLIIADEPTTALDVTVQKQILQLLRELQRTASTAVLFITHNLGVVGQLCEQVTVLHAGSVVEHGPVAQLFEAPLADYTRALFAATPRYDRPADTLHAVPAAVTDALWTRARRFDAAHADELSAVGGRFRWGP